MKQVNALLDNDWIYECGGPYGSLIVLAPKPHQEHVNDINKFIWRMCVSYRQLNAITKPFEYPIPRCDDAITILIVGGDEIYIITVDARQGYHQVAVRKLDQEKLAFFAPDGKKYTWKVMPFGPMNAPAFYTAMMGAFKVEWDKLFIQELTKKHTIGNQKVVLKSDGTTLVGTKTVSTGSKVIIDDILIWSNNLEMILLYFECICRVFVKYRVSFRLDKCEFLKNRVEYVGHDLMPSGNCPAKSKFNLISDWKLPTTGTALHSFVGLVNFYAKYCPFFEVKLKPLRRMIKDWYRTSIPLMAWSPSLIELFEELKADITSSPVLARFDPSKPTFLKTDWSAEGMGWILMQPSDDEESRPATVTLRETGECLFDLSAKEGPRLRPIAYGSQACTDMEKLFHSFVGEGACGRWAISQNRKFLWGNHFYWMCDCKAMREILEYDGAIAMISRWAQELLGYHFTVIHRSAKMMMDVDGLTRRFGPAIAEYMMIASILSDRDKAIRPSAYVQDFKAIEKPTKAYKKDNGSVEPAVILTHKRVREITALRQQPDVASTVPHTAMVFALQTAPITIRTSANTISVSDSNQNSIAMQPAEAMEIVILCLDDVIGSVLSWSQQFAPPQFIWTVHNMFTCESSSELFRHMYNRDNHNGIFSFRGQPPQIALRMHRFEANFIPHANGSSLEWLQKSITWIMTISASKSSRLRQATLWIRTDFFQSQVEQSCRDILSKLSSDGWIHTITQYNTARLGDSVAADRTGIHLHLEEDASTYSSVNVPSILDHISSYGHHVVQEMNNVLDTEMIPIPFNIIKQMVPANVDRYRPYPICATKASDTSHQHHASDILDPGFPGKEPCRYRSQHAIFGNRFGVPFKARDNSWYARAVSTLELLRMYSIPEHRLHNPKVYLNMHAAANGLLPCSIPFEFRRWFMESESICHALIDPFTFGEDAHVNGIQCFFTESKPPASLEWETSYQADEDTAKIRSMLEGTKPDNIKEEDIKTVNMSYRDHLRKGRIHSLNGRLVLMKPILMNTKHVVLIIVPPSNPTKYTFA
jgi:hypothetical protein